MIEHNPRPGWDKEKILPRRFVKGPQYKLYDDGKLYDCENDALEQAEMETANPELAALESRYQTILDSLRKYRTFGRILSLSSEFDKIVPPHAKIEVLAQGFTWTEGPVWVESEQALLFSDVPRNTAYKWTDIKGVEVYLNPSGYTGSKPRSGGKGSNGLTLDNKGNLILCRHGDREIARMSSSLRLPQPLFESLATHYNGKKLNSPNDVVVDSKGNIYFTDPPYGIDKDQPGARELDINGVYRINTDGSLELMVEDLDRPNGIGLSPSEDLLYVANSNPPVWMAYELDKKLPIKGKLLFDGSDLLKASISGQAPDGMDVNSNGIIFATGPDGVIVLTPEGEHLGTIYTGKKTSNCTLNDDETVLYVTCDDYILRVILGYKLAAGS